MCDSQQPANGADSGDGRTPWLVSVVDRDEPDARPFWMDMTAYGVHDIKGQLRDSSPNLVVLSVVEGKR